MDRTYSIAEARNALSNVVREAEAGQPVTLARRGRPVAVIISAQAFSRMERHRPTVADVVSGFRRDHKEDLDNDDWVPTRDASPGRTTWRP